jgi:hypothetical protein
MSVEYALAAHGRARLLMGSYRHRDGDNTRESAYRQDRKRRWQGGQQSTAGRGHDEDGPLRWLRWLSCLRVTMEATTLHREACEREQFGQKASP